jgi:hypothetical protein
MRSSAVSRCATRLAQRDLEVEVSGRRRTVIDLVGAQASRRRRFVRRPDRLLLLITSICGSAAVSLLLAGVGRGWSLCVGGLVAGLDCWVGAREGWCIFSQKLALSGRFGASSRPREGLAGSG